MVNLMRDRIVSHGTLGMTIAAWVLLLAGFSTPGWEVIRIQTKLSYYDTVTSYHVGLWYWVRSNADIGYGINEVVTEAHSSPMIIKPSVENRDEEYVNHIDPYVWSQGKVLGSLAMVITTLACALRFLLVLCSRKLSNAFKWLGTIVLVFLYIISGVFALYVSAIFIDELELRRPETFVKLKAAAENFEFAYSIFVFVFGGFFECVIAVILVGDMVISVLCCSKRTEECSPEKQDDVMAPKNDVTNDITEDTPELCARTPLKQKEVV